MIRNVLVLERLLRGLTKLNRKGIAAFTSGVLVGLVVNALSDSSLNSPGDVLHRLFDVRQRSIAWLNVVLFIALAVLLVAPRALAVLEKRRHLDAGIALLVNQVRMPQLLNKGVVSIDGAATLQRCPNMHDGWMLDERDISFTHRDISWEPPHELQLERDALRSELLGAEGEHDGRFVRIMNSPSAFSDAPTLTLNAETVLFSDLVFFRERMLVPDAIGNYVNAAVDSAEISFPHGTSAQIVIATSDGGVLMVERSWKVRWFPGRWSCSIEETMTTEDIKVGGNSVGALRALVTRAMREEVGLVEGEHFRLPNVRLLAVFVEAAEQLLSVPLLFVCRLDITTEALHARLTLAHREDDEFRRWELVPPERLLHYLSVEQSMAFHPTSRYRMLMYLLNEWGHETLRRRWDSLVRNGAPSDDGVGQTAVVQPVQP